MKNNFDTVVDANIYHKQIQLLILLHTCECYPEQPSGIRSMVFVNFNLVRFWARRDWNSYKLETGKVRTRK